MPITQHAYGLRFTFYVSRFTLTKRRLKMRIKYILIGIVVGVLLTSAVVVLAGNLDSPAGPTNPASQM